MIQQYDGSAPYEHDCYNRLEDAQRAVQAARLSYPEGDVWIEDENGKAFSTTIL